MLTPSDYLIAEFDEEMADCVRQELYHRNPSARELFQIISDDPVSDLSGNHLEDHCSICLMVPADWHIKYVLKVYSVTQADLEYSAGRAHP